MDKPTYIHIDLAKGKDIHSEKMIKLEDKPMFTCKYCGKEFEKHVGDKCITLNPNFPVCDDCAEELLVELNEIFTDPMGYVCKNKKFEKKFSSDRMKELISEYAELQDKMRKVVKNS